MSKIKSVWFILGIIFCSWYVPFIAVLSLASGIKNSSSIDMLLIPFFTIFVYVFGLIFIYEYTKIDKREIKIEREVLPKRIEEPVILLTVCWKCEMKYPYSKNPRGDTIVQCPNCGSKGLIK